MFPAWVLGMNLLPHRVCISRKPELEAEPGFELRHCDKRCMHFGLWITCCVKPAPYLTFGRKSSEAIIPMSHMETLENSERASGLVSE